MYKKNKLLEGTISLITGGSRGIGREIARLFADNGSKIFITYNKDLNSAKSIQKMIRKENGFCEIIKIDLSKQDLKNRLKEIQKKYKKIDILVNNAGYLKQMNFMKINKKEWDKTFKVNLSSVFFTIQSIVPIFKKNGGGNIINLSSIGGQTGGTKAPHYAAAKLAVISLTKSFAKLLSPFKIRVNAISPGIIRTDLVKGMIKREGEKNINKNIPLNHIGSVSDISEAALFLASKKSKYITGQVLNINGGAFLG